MHKFFSRIALIGTALSLAACGGPDQDAGQDLLTTEAELGSYRLTREQHRQLTEARNATARYTWIGNAIRDGFVDSGLPCFDGQGYHWIRPDRLNTYDIREPAILVYSPAGKLVALEWAAPVDAVGGVRPSMFGETFHGPVLDPPLFVLHTWVWEYNPDGVFADRSPNITCPAP